MNKLSKKILYVSSIFGALLLGVGVTVYANGLSWRDNIASIQRTFDEFSSLVSGQKTKISQLEIDYKAKENEVEDLKQKLSEQEIANQNNQSYYNDLKNQYSQLENKYTTDMNNKNNEIQQKDNEISQKRKEIEQKQKEIQEKITEIQQKINEGNQKVSEIQKQLDLKNQELNTVTQEKNSLLTELEQIKQSIIQTDEYGKQKLEDAKK